MTKKKKAPMAKKAAPKTKPPVKAKSKKALSLRKGPAKTKSSAKPKASRALARKGTAAVVKAPQVSDENRDLALLATHAIIDKKAENTIILNVGAVGSFTDYFVISSGNSERQVQSMADEAIQRMKALGYMPRIEGYEQGRWVLVDCDAVILHLFHADIRGFYNLEDLWQGSPRVAIPQEFYTTPLPPKQRQ